MSDNNPIRPEDLLPDGVDTTTINGKTVRKGTIAAFMANIDILENPVATEKQKQDATDTLRDLAPTVVAIGLHKHAIFKNPTVEKLVNDVDNSMS